MNSLDAVTALSSIINRASFSNLIGYVASLLVFMTFYMKRMLPLRLVAIASNLAFIAYAFAQMLYPVLILHLALLPLNACRLLQSISSPGDRAVSESGKVDFETLRPYMTKLRTNQNETLFKAGEHARNLYYISHGEVQCLETHRMFEQGAFIGAFDSFSPHEKRTTTAVCRTDCQIYSLSKADLATVLCRHPEYSLAFMRVISHDVLSHHEAALQPAVDGSDLSRLRSSLSKNRRQMA